MIHIKKLENAYAIKGGALDLIGSQDYFWVNIYKL